MTQARVLGVRVDCLDMQATLDRIETLVGAGGPHLIATVNPEFIMRARRDPEFARVLETADLCLAPLATGAGVKTKVLHYLAHGKRIAGTPIAFEGLSGAPGLLEAPLDALPALVARIIAVPEGPDAARSRVAAQHGWLAEHHGRPLIVSQWRNVLACVNEN